MSANTKIFYLIRFHHKFTKLIGKKYFVFANGNQLRLGWF